MTMALMPVAQFVLTGKALLKHSKRKLSLKVQNYSEIDINVIHHTGDTYCETIKNGLVTCLKWQDKREVKLLSTFHTGENTVVKRRRSKNVEGGIEEIIKPLMIHDYNQNMGGVDRNDQMILYYGYSHRYVFINVN